MASVQHRKDPYLAPPPRYRRHTMVNYNPEQRDHRASASLPNSARLASTPRSNSAIDRRMMYRSDLDLAMDVDLHDSYPRLQTDVFQELYKKYPLAFRRRLEAREAGRRLFNSRPHVRFKDEIEISDDIRSSPMSFDQHSGSSSHRDLTNWDREVGHYLRHKTRTRDCLTSVEPSECSSTGLSLSQRLRMNSQHLNKLLSQPSPKWMQNEREGVQYDSGTENEQTLQEYMIEKSKERSRNRKKQRQIIIQRKISKDGNISDLNTKNGNSMVSGTGRWLSKSASPTARHRLRYGLPAMSLPNSHREIDVDDLMTDSDLKINTLLDRISMKMASPDSPPDSAIDVETPSVTSLVNSEIVRADKSSSKHHSDNPGLLSVQELHTLNSVDGTGNSNGPGNVTNDGVVPSVMDSASNSLPCVRNNNNSASGVTVDLQPSSRNKSQNRKNSQQSNNGSETHNETSKNDPTVHGPTNIDPAESKVGNNFIGNNSNGTRSDESSAIDPASELGNNLNSPQSRSKFLSHCSGDMSVTAGGNVCVMPAVATDIYTSPREINEMCQGKGSIDVEVPTHGVVLSNIQNKQQQQLYGEQQSQQFGGCRVRTRATAQNVDGVCTGDNEGVNGKLINVDLEESISQGEVLESNARSGNSELHSSGRSAANIASLVECENNLVEIGRSSVENGRSSVENGRSSVENGRNLVENGRSSVENGRSSVEIGRNLVQSGCSSAESERSLVQTEQEIHVGRKEAIKDATDESTADGVDLLQVRYNSNDFRKTESVHKGCSNHTCNDGTDIDDGEESVLAILDGVLSNESLPTSPVPNNTDKLELDGTYDLQVNTDKLGFNGAYEHLLANTDKLESKESTSANCESMQSKQVDRPKKDNKSVCSKQELYDSMQKEQKSGFINQSDLSGPKELKQSMQSKPQSGRVIEDSTKEQNDNDVVIFENADANNYEDENVTSATILRLLRNSSATSPTKSLTYNVNKSTKSPTDKDCVNNSVENIGDNCVGVENLRAGNDGHNQHEEDMKKTTKAANAATKNSRKKGVGGENVNYHADDEGGAEEMVAMETTVNASSKKMKSKPTTKDSDVDSGIGHSSSICAELPSSGKSKQRDATLKLQPMKADHSILPLRSEVDVNILDEINLRHVSHDVSRRINTSCVDETDETDIRFGVSRESMREKKVKERYRANRSPFIVLNSRPSSAAGFRPQSAPMFVRSEIDLRTVDIDLALSDDESLSDTDASSEDLSDVEDIISRALLSAKPGGGFELTGAIPKSKVTSYPGYRPGPESDAFLKYSSTPNLHPSAINRSRSPESPSLDHPHNVHTSSMSTQLENRHSISPISSDGRYDSPNQTLHSDNTTQILNANYHGAMPQMQAFEHGAYFEIDDRNNDPSPSDLRNRKSRDLWNRNSDASGVGLWKRNEDASAGGSGYFNEVHFNGAGFSAGKTKIDTKKGKYKPGPAESSPRVKEKRLKLKNMLKTKKGTFTPADQEIVVPPDGKPLVSRIYAKDRGSNRSSARSSGEFEYGTPTGQGANMQGTYEAELQYSGNRKTRLDLDLEQVCGSERRTSLDFCDSKPVNGSDIKATSLQHLGQRLQDDLRHSPVVMEIDSASDSERTEVRKHSAETCDTKNREKANNFPSDFQSNSGNFSGNRVGKIDSVNSEVYNHFEGRSTPDNSESGRSLTRTPDSELSQGRSSSTGSTPPKAKPPKKPARMKNKNLPRNPNIGANPAMPGLGVDEAHSPRPSVSSSDMHSQTELRSSTSDEQNHQHTTEAEDVPVCQEPLTDIPLNNTDEIEVLPIQNSNLTKSRELSASKGSLLGKTKGTFKRFRKAMSLERGIDRAGTSGTGSQRSEPSPPPAVVAVTVGKVKKTPSLKSFTSFFKRKKKKGKFHIEDIEPSQQDSIPPAIHSGHAPLSDNKRKQWSSCHTLSPVETPTHLNQPIGGQQHSNQPIAGQQHSNQPMVVQQNSNQPIAGQQNSNQPMVGRQNSNKPIGKLKKVNPDGTRLVQLVKPEDGPLGFFLAKGNAKYGHGIFVSRFSSSHPGKYFSGLLDVGDEIIEVNGRLVRDLSQDAVYNLISAKQRILLKVFPFAARKDV